MKTRFELVLILLCSVTLCSCGAYERGYQEALTESSEAHLKDSLSMMRDGIKKYTNDKGMPPQSLDELTDEGYITHVPRDMITNEIGLGSCPTRLFRVPKLQEGHQGCS